MFSNVSLFKCGLVSSPCSKRIALVNRKGGHVYLKQATFINELEIALLAIYDFFFIQKQ